MKNKIKLGLATAAIALLATGCSQKYSNMHTINPSFANNAAEYKILERVTGTAECQTFLWFEVGESNCSHGLFSVLTGGSDGKPVPVEQKAMTRAVDAIPNADALLAPRFSYEEHSIPFIMEKKRITVSGKAIEFQ